ncbi:DNA/RNA nuclease SfsA [Clostridiaceae bacterium 35-E11]
MNVKIHGKLYKAKFVRRLNRFVAEIELEGQKHYAHVANTGRMKELLVKDATVLVRYVNEAHRKTKYDLVMVYYKQSLVCIDSKLPNILLEKALKNNEIHSFKGFTSVKKEVQFGSSRLDIAVNNGKEMALIEAKCVTYVREDGVASFPDAPTERGRKHVLELIKARKQGIRAAVFFIIQREDAKSFTPNKAMDTKFADAVIKAGKEGVEFYAFLCKNTPSEIRILKEIPVFFKG